jgi:diaminopimelate decarboxylase
MIQFVYIKDKLHLKDGSELKDLSQYVKGKEDAFYLYYLKDFSDRAKFYKSCFRPQDSIHFAMKSNSHPNFLKAARQQGLCLDLVSGGELRKALDAGFKRDQLIFSGVGKSKKDIEFALQDPISQINVESPMELRRIGEIAKRLNQTARVALRYNPNVSADTHPYIRTGFKENKFGMDESFIPELSNILSEFSSNLKMVGMTLHIGSQILSVDSLVEAVEKTIPVFKYFQEQGHPLETFDIGGGVGIDYQNDPTTKEFDRIQQFASRVIPLIEPLGCRIICEPGRFLAARSGMLLTQVEYVKRTPYKNFVIVNSGMHHLMRPSLYKAYHRTFPLIQNEDEAQFVCDIVGPVCESSDVIGYDRRMTVPKSGDWLVVLDTGAYGAVMSSSYNSFPAAEEIFI